MDRVQQIEYRTSRSEETRCYFCKNKCLRTFIDVKTGDAEQPPSEGAPREGVLVDLTTHVLKSGPESGHPTRMNVLPRSPSNSTCRS